MTCIFRQSSYYKNAKINPSQIVPPLGAEPVGSGEQDRHKSISRKTNRKPIDKIVVHNSQMKVISTRCALLKDIQRYLTLNPAVQRKSYCLNGQNLQFANSLDFETLQQLKKSFMPNCVFMRSMVHLEKINIMSIIMDNLFHLKNYAISTFMVFYDSNDDSFHTYFKRFLNEHLIEYDNEVLISNPRLGRPQLKKIDYNRKEEIEEQINEIEHLGQWKNRFYSGLHIYLCDNMPKVSNPRLSILQEETQLWDYLHYHIAVITATLDDGANAFLKIGGTFTQKTIEYILLLRFVFNKIYFYKWMCDNPFTNDKWVICQNFNKEQGRYVSKYLLDNFEQIKKGGEKLLMVEFKALFANEFHTCINDFNNSSPIIKVTKEHQGLLHDHQLSCYPNSSKLLLKTQNLPFPIDNFQIFKEQFLKCVPEAETAKPVKEKKVLTQKQAQTFDFDAMSKLANATKTVEWSKQQLKEKKFFDLARGDSPVQILQLVPKRQRGKHRLKKDNNQMDKKE